MARKSAIHITSAEVGAAEYRADAAKDRAPRRVLALDERGIGRTLAEGRAVRGQCEPRELLEQCRKAAALELRGAMYSGDDRADVAAQIMVAVLESTAVDGRRGAMPRHDSPRVQIGRLCGDAKNYRRAIDARREREAIDAKKRATDYANSSDALRPDDAEDSTPAKHVHIVARSGELIGERAADAVCGMLGLPADHDAPHWTLFYQWVRGAAGITPEQCAAERSVTWGAWRVRQTRGAKFVRGFYGAAELIARLTEGATDRVTIGAAPTDTRRVIGGSGKVYAHPLDYGECETRAAAELTYCVTDKSREAHGRTPILADSPHAPHWREYQIDDTAEVQTRQMRAADKVHWRRRRDNRADVLQSTADAALTLNREYARQSRRKEPTAAPTSELKAAMSDRRAA